MRRECLHTILQYVEDNTVCIFKRDNQKPADSAVQQGEHGIHGVIGRYAACYDDRGLNQNGKRRGEHIVVEWGEGIFGIEAASLHYYGKPASYLTPEESARLASVLPNPKKYNPARTPKYMENRSRTIYHIMVKRGIVREECEIDEQVE